MNIYWQHLSGKTPSPKYSSPEPLLQFSDRYYEDYVIRHNNSFLMKTIGFRQCDPTYRMINKYSERHVIHYILHGDGWCNNTFFQAGDIIYFKSHVPYNFSSNPSNPCSYAWITFEGEAVERYLEYMGLMTKFKIWRTRHDQAIYSILYNLLYVHHPDVDIQLYFDSMFLQLLSLSIPEESDEEENSAEQKRTGSRFKTAIEYISKHYKDADFRVKQVASAMGISEKYFQTLFKKEFGTSVLHYVIQMRIDAAKLLLRDSNYNINEISEFVGFSDHRQFSEIFKRKTGKTPSQYRKDHTAKNRLDL